ncbi:MAG: SDR family NAD(P)-dependent oxidoreductase [Lachnospiraceae bacterium]|nr:SDR family NAD(P)-dependent oxidoreductase [Lachnospiraceae bacterium]
MIGLVTGAAQGLGLALVTLGLEKGDTLIAACRKVNPLPETLLVLKERYQERLIIQQMDVTHEAQVSQAASEVQTATGHLDFLVNNAGVLFESKYDDGDAITGLDIEKYRKTIDVNAVGPAIVLKYFMPLLYQAKEPCIINITSEAGNLDTEGWNYLSYGVSKYAANMYTQKIRNYLAHEKKEEHIRIFMLHPGRMNTVMGKENAQIEAEESAEGIYRILERKVDPKLEIPFINYKGEPMS